MTWFWTSLTNVEWNKNDTNRTYQCFIYYDEAHLQPVDLTDILLSVRIRHDGIDHSNKFKKNDIKPKDKDIFEFKFKDKEVPEVGKWKLEIGLSKKGNNGYSEIGYTHHDDFNVVE